MKGKIIIAALILIIVVPIGFYRYMLYKYSQKPAPAPTQVEVIKIEKQLLSDDVKLLGNAYANESVQITANVSEIISDINFTDGQEVKKGDVIVLLEQQEEQSQLKSAKLQLAEHLRELNRLEKLLQNKAASKKDYDQRFTQVEITKQQIEEIKARINDRTITAPFDGVLGIRTISVGSLVKPGDIITTIDDLSKIKLDFDIPEIYLSDIKIGDEIEAKAAALGDRIFKGYINSINSRINTDTRSVLARALIDNVDNSLKSGLLMQLTIFKNRKEVIAIPEESTLQHKNEYSVYIVNPEGNIVEKRVIETGIHKDGVIEVVKGLKEGELLIVRGIMKVGDGQNVNIKMRNAIE